MGSSAAVGETRVSTAPETLIRSSWKSPAVGGNGGREEEVRGGEGKAHRHGQRHRGNAAWEHRRCPLSPLHPSHHPAHTSLPIRIASPPVALSPAAHWAAAPAARNRRPRASSAARGGAMAATAACRLWRRSSLHDKAGEEVLTPIRRGFEGRGNAGARKRHATLCAGRGSPPLPLQSRRSLCRARPEAAGPRT